ncbi:MAG TPA: hypothetical protein VMH40_18295 [Myxococcaceae bacterium]|nr:hypothetical protein [Myxococcaceae bacterium]
MLAGDSMPVANTLRFALEYEYLTATARSDDEPDRTESLTQMTLRPVVVYSPYSVPRTATDTDSGTRCCGARR